MISGERGQAVLEAMADLRLEGLVDGDRMGTTLIAACFAEAIRKGESPRAIALALWDGLPDDEQWDDAAREKVTEAIEEFERNN